MNLLIIADDEFVGTRIPDCPADILISLGDMPDDIIFAAAAKCGCQEILAVKGNHDSSAPFRPPIRDLHLAVFQFRGISFGGFCGCWKYKPRGHYLFEQSEVEQGMTNFPAVDVFVAHNSPRLVHDREDEVHIGFAAFNHYIRRAKPKFLLHGHHHENAESIIEGTRVVGIYGYRFLVIPE